MNGAISGGFVFSGGTRIPGGAMTVLDPAFSSDAPVDVGDTNPKAPVFLFAVGAIIAMMMAIRIVAVIVRER
jgi:hypothetical protein